MGKRRKYQPDYELGVDRRGRPAWRSVHSGGTAPAAPPPVDVDGYESIGGYAFPKVVGAPWAADSPDLPTDFRCQNLSGLILNRVNLRTANLRGADLTYAVISNSDVSGADFTRVAGEGAEMWEVYFTGASFARSDFAGLSIRDASGSDVDFSDTLLSDSHFYGVKVYGGSFANANLHASKFTHLNGDDLDFTGADLSGVLFDGRMGAPSCHLTDCVFRGADLTSVVFRGAVLEGADFTDADFTGADLSGVVLPGRTERARRVTLTGANITTRQVSALLDGNEPGCARQLIYKRHPIGDLQAAHRWSDAELIVQVWAGDIEIRDNATQEVVTGQFDRDRHHVPQWVIGDAGRRRGA